MNQKPDDVFTVCLQNGRAVEVSWYKNYFTNTDHLELRGPMTETGYRSDFINKADADELDPDSVKEHARQLAEKCWEENKQKHGRQATLL